MKKIEKNAQCIEQYVQIKKQIRYEQYQTKKQKMEKCMTSSPFPINCQTIAQFSVRFVFCINLCADGRRRVVVGSNRCG